MRPRGGPIFGTVLAASLFRKMGPPGGLCFGAALQPALCVLVVGGRSWQLPG